MDYDKLARETLGRSGLPLHTVIAQALARADISGRVEELEHAKELAFGRGEVFRDEKLMRLGRKFKQRVDALRKRLEELGK